MRSLVLVTLFFTTLGLHAQRMVVAEQIRETSFGSVWSSCASVDDNTIIIASDEGRYALYDLQRRVLTGHRIPRNVELTTLAVGQDGSWYVGDGEGALWTSVDRGSTWHRAVVDTARIVKVLSTNGRVLIITRSGAVYERREDGTILSLRSFPGVTLFDADEREGRLALVGSGGFIATASSDGLAWQVRGTQDAFAYTSVLRVSEDTLVVGGMKGTLMVSHDDGESWVYRTQLVRYLGVDTGQYDRQDRTYDLAIDKDGRIVVGHYYSSLSVGSGQGPCRYVISKDGGKTWDVGRLEEESPDGAFWDGVPLAATHTHTDGSIFVLGSSAPYGVGAIYRLQPFDARPKIDTFVVTLAERDSSFARPTLAIGEQRTVVDSRSTLYSMNRVSVYGVLRRVALRKSADTGRTWLNVGSLSNSSVGIAATNDAIYVAESPCIIRRSTDDGTTWNSIFELPEQPAFTRMYRVGSTPGGAIYFHYGFASWDGVRKRHSANAIVIHRGVAKELPVPESLDSISITDITAGPDNNVWYVATGYPSGESDRRPYVCNYDLDANTSRSWFIPRSSEAATTVPRILLVRDDRVLIARSVDTVIDERLTSAGRLHWLRIADTSFDEIAELRGFLDQWSMQTLDVMDFGSTLAIALTSTMISYDLSSGRSTPVTIRGSSTTRLGKNSFRAPVRVGEHYVMLGENQSVIAVRMEEGTTSVQSHEHDSFDDVILYPNPATRSSVVSLASPHSAVVLEVRDLLGKLVLRTTSASFATTDMSPGIYTVRIVVDQAIRSRTLVVL